MYCILSHKMYRDAEQEESSPNDVTLLNGKEIICALLTEYFEDIERNVFLFFDSDLHENKFMKLGNLRGNSLSFGEFLRTRKNAPRCFVNVGNEAMMFMSYLFPTFFII